MLNKFSFFLVLVVSLLILFQINSNKSKALEYMIASNHGHRSLAWHAAQVGRGTFGGVDGPCSRDG